MKIFKNTLKKQTFSEKRFCQTQVEIFQRNPEGLHGRDLFPLGQPWSIGGKLKSTFEDWHVTEIGLDGVEAKITNYDIPPLPIDVSHGLNRLQEKRDWFQKGYDGDISDEALKTALGEEGWENLQYLIADQEEEDVMLCKLRNTRDVFTLRGLIGKKYPQLDTYRNVQTEWSNTGDVGRSYYVFAKWDRGYFRLKQYFSEAVSLKVLDFIRGSYLGFTESAMIIEDVDNAVDVAEKIPLVFSTIKVEVDTPTSLILSWGKRRSKGEIKDYPHVKFCLKKVGRETNQLIKNIQSRTGLGKRDIGLAGTKDAHGITHQWVTVNGLSPTDIVHTFGKTAGCDVGNFSWTHKHLKLGELKGNRFGVRIRDVEQSEEYIGKGIDYAKEYGFINYFGRQRFGTDYSSAEVGKLIYQKKFKEAVKILLTPRPFDNDWNKALVYFQESEDAGGALEMIHRSERTTVLKGQMLMGIKHFGFDEEGCLKTITGLNPLHKSLYPQAYLNALWNHVVSERILLGLEPMEGDFLATSTLRDPEQLASAEEAKNYAMTDIVYPIPGTFFEKNEYIRNVYEPLIGKDGLTWDDLNLTETVQLNIRGWFRGVLVKPANLEYNFEKDDDEETNLCLDFVLPSSSYATVMLDAMIGKHT